MFSNFNKNNDLPEVPEWASFFNASEYGEFVRCIENYFTKKNITFELGNGVMKLGENQYGFTSLGLANIAQVCKQDSIKNYNKVITGHFESMVKVYDFNTEFNKIVHDYDKVKHYIGVRLYPNDYVSSLREGATIGKEFSGNIFAMLVFDLPESITNVQPEQAKKWGKNINELFYAGLQNIKKNYTFDITKHEFDGLVIWFVLGKHFFTPNIVFDLDNYPQLVGSKGSLIGIPNRQTVIIYPIENIDILTAINKLIPVIYGMNIDGPGSISNNLFWFKDNHFENLPYKIEDDSLQFFPPDNFIELLKSLSLGNTSLN